MEQTATDAEAATDRCRSTAVVDAIRTHGLEAALVFAVTTPVALVWFRTAWRGLTQSLVTPELADQLAVISFDPLSILATQAALAVATGLVLALETLAYGARRRWLPTSWWAGGPLAPRWRQFLILVGALLFPVALLFGQWHVALLAADHVLTTVTPPSLVRATGLLGLVTILAGLALQVAFALAVVALSRVLPHP